MAAPDIELLGDDVNAIARGLTDGAATVDEAVRSGWPPPDAGPSTSRVGRAIADASDAIVAFTGAVAATAARVDDSVRLYRATDSTTAAELQRIRSA